MRDEERPTVFAHPPSSRKCGSTDLGRRRCCRVCYNSCKRMRDEENPVRFSSSLIPHPSSLIPSTGEATVDELTREDVTAAADAVIDELFEAAGVTTHPVDAVALARHLGLVLTPDHPGRGRGPGSLRPVPTAERLQWAAAQEVAVRLRPAFLVRLGLSEDGPHPLFAESPTNLLAQRLLLPTVWFTASAVRACCVCHRRPRPAPPWTWPTRPVPLRWPGACWIWRNRASSPLSTTAP